MREFPVQVRNQGEEAGCGEKRHLGQRNGLGQGGEGTCGWECSGGTVISESRQLINRTCCPEAPHPSFVLGHPPEQVSEGCVSSLRSSWAALSWRPQKPT